MKRRMHGTKARTARSIGAIAVSAALATGAFVAPKPAAAQEIQLTGPLAGAPAVRKLRLYREGRAEIAVGWAPTLLDEYERSNFVAGRLQYNIFDWLGIGVFGGYNVVNIDTDLTDKIDSTAPRNSRTAVNLAPKAGTPNGQAYGDQTGKLTWMATPQLTFSPFRGKLAVFQKLFVDTDLYLHAGAAFVGVKERKECGQNPGTPCTVQGNPSAFKTEDRVAVAPSFGLGLTLYLSRFVSLNAEYRAFPFEWNRGGFDSRGAPPDASFPDNRINAEDRTFKFNQMVFIAVGFAFPSPKISD